MAQQVRFLPDMTPPLLADPCPGAVYALDLTSDEEIATLAKATRVVINVIGPYATSCGPAVIKACAENGTDYVDWHVPIVTYTGSLLLTCRIATARCPGFKP